MAKKYRNKEVGNRGEDLAESFLRERGYKIVARNWAHGKGVHCTGEVDIIALTPLGILSFIEVKSRESATLDEGNFTPEAAFNTTKYKRFMSAVNAYVQEMDYQGDITISLVAINIKRDGNNDIRFYEDMRIY